jgi:hypothetical protein
MASKIGKALGFTMDHGGETKRQKKFGYNESDISKIVEGKGPDPVDAGGDLPSDLESDEEAPVSESGEDPMASDEPEGTGSAEVLAMKQFGRATTPEAKVAALKDFLEALGVFGGM